MMAAAVATSRKPRPAASSPDKQHSNSTVSKIHVHKPSYEQRNGSRGHVEGSILHLSSVHDRSKENIFSHHSADRIKELVGAAIKGNDVLRVETDMFQSYLPGGIGNERVFSVTPTNQDGSVSSGRSHIVKSISRHRHADSRMQNSRTPILEKLLTLSADNKCDIVQSELEKLQESQKRTKHTREKAIDKLKAIMEEGSTRNDILRRQRYEFERDVIKASKNSTTLNTSLKGMVFAEKVMKYFEHRNHNMDAFISKTKLKNVTLAQNLKRLQLHLKQKEEIGDILTEIDFKQLKIENAENLERIEERNKDFFRLKQTGTRCLYLLNQYKLKMHHMTMEGTQLQADITSRRELIVRLNTEITVIGAERVQARNTNRKYKRHLDMHVVPSVEDAINLQYSVQELTKEVNSWGRKVHIAEMALQAQKLIWLRLKGAAELQGGLPMDEVNKNKVVPAIGASSWR